MPKGDWINLSASSIDRKITKEIDRWKYQLDKKVLWARSNIHEVTSQLRVDPKQELTVCGLIIVDNPQPIKVGLKYSIVPDYKLEGELGKIEKIRSETNQVPHKS